MGVFYLRDYIKYGIIKVEQTMNKSPKARLSYTLKCKTSNKRRICMKTKQHIALAVMAAANKKMNVEEYVREEIPFLVLPDAIRAYIPQRKSGHFEISPDGTQQSWMEFPDAEILKRLTKENARERIRYFVATETPKCVIGEETQIDEFERKNFSHRHYHSLRIHMLQDIILDDVLRSMMVDVKRRFVDRFKIRHSGNVIDGARLRSQVDKFEDFGFITLAGAVYRSTGILLNEDFWEHQVREALLQAYPEDLALNTYRFMKLSEEDNERINNKKFDLSEREKANVYMAEDLTEVLATMYSRAYNATWRQV